jgi:hypothetical protein
MRRRFLATAGVLGAVIVAAGMTVAAQAPAAGKGKKTAWGHPDLQGVWASNSATPLERPKELEGRKTLTEQELASLRKNAADLFDGETDAAFGDSVFVNALKGSKDFKSNDGGTGNYNHFWLVDRTFDNRTSLITDPPDGRLPAMTAEGRARQTEAAERRRLHPADGPEDRSLGERCIGSGVPMTGRGYNSNYQILQTPDHVVIHLEMMHDTRIVPLDGRPHVGQRIGGYLGDSRGRWEGDTLVIETTNFKGNRRGASGGTLTERFTRVANDALHYEYTVNDPTTYTKPYTAMIVMTPAPGSGKIYEFACHEGNHGMLGILSGHRAQEKAAGDAARKSSQQQ